MKKSRKYHPLCCSIRSNGWSTYFCAIEVGAWDFCAESVRSCLRSLSFNNKHFRKTLKTLSFVFALEIWLCQNSKTWALDHPVCRSNLEPIKKKSNTNGVSTSINHHTCTPVCSVTSPKSAGKHCGIIIKDNTF